MQLQPCDHHDGRGARGRNLPRTAHDSIKRIIIKERPDSLLASLGGQTGLTIGCKLAKEGFLDKWGVKLIGTKVDAIDRAEDRELFKETMQKIGQPVVPSDIAYTVEECVAVANKIGYPVITGIPSSSAPRSRSAAPAAAWRTTKRSCAPSRTTG